MQIEQQPSYANFRGAGLCAKKFIAHTKPKTDINFLEGVAQIKPEDVRAKSSLLGSSMTDLFLKDGTHITYNSGNMQILQGKNKSGILAQKRYSKWYIMDEMKKTPEVKVALNKATTNLDSINDFH